MTDVNMSANNITIGDNPEYINPVVFSVFVLSVMALGVMGNILMIFTFSKAKYNTFSYSVYFRVLSVVDAIILCLEFQHVLTCIIQLNPERFESSRLAVQKYCLVSSFINDVARLISATLYFVIPFDRIIVCVMPFRFRKFAKPYTARIVCLVIVVFSLFMSIPETVYVTTEMDSKRMDCKIYGDYALNNFKTFKAFGYHFTISFPLALAFNFILLIKIKSYLERRKTLRVKHSDEQKEARISAYFIAVTLFSMLVTLPRCAFSVAQHLGKSLPEDEAANINEVHLDAREQIIVISMLNYATNYYILIMLWKSVRDSFKSLFLCRKAV